MSLLFVESIDGRWSAVGGEGGGERDGGGERRAGKGDGQARRQRRGGYCGGGGEVRQGGAKSAPGPSRLGVLPAPPLSLQSSE